MLSRSGSSIVLSCLFTRLRAAGHGHRRLSMMWLQDGFGGLAIGMRIEIQNDAVPQDAGAIAATSSMLKCRRPRISASTRPHSISACAPRGELP